MDKPLNLANLLQNRCPRCRYRIGTITYGRIFYIYCYRCRFEIPKSRYKHFIIELHKLFPDAVY